MALVAAALSAGIGETGVAAPGQTPVRAGGVLAPNIVQWWLYYPAVLELSDLSRQLNVEQEGTPDRAERVVELRLDFEAGRYQPDPRAVAASLIQDAFEWKG